MGAKQSSAAAKETAAASTNDATSAPAPLLKFGVILQGLSGSGVSAVQTAAALPMGRVLHVDERFLTSPPIYSTEWDSPNHPDNGGGLWAKAERDVWSYGGRSVRQLGPHSADCSRHRAELCRGRSAPLLTLLQFARLMSAD